MNWLAKRTTTFESSGIRKVFDLGAKLKNPINLSIGQPHFSVPQPVKDAMIDALENDKSSYTPTQGLAALREFWIDNLKKKYPSHDDRNVFITSGTSGGLVLTVLATVDAGDEVIFTDPYFVMYDPLVKMFGGVSVPISTYPDFRIDVQKISDAITPRTKLILFNSPANPTGYVASRKEVEAVAKLAQERNILLVSDEIYSMYSYDSEFVSPAEYNPATLVLEGYSKTHAMTGWRVGVAHGPSEVIEQMLKLQQYTFVCAPQVGQWGALEAHDVPMDKSVADYKRKRDMLVEGLSNYYELGNPSGAFYMYPKAPWGTATEFVQKAIEDYSLLVIPGGGVFSTQDTHFRLSYAASDASIHRGIEALLKLAKR
ncbi:MAG: aminotransferase class I/II-fold pyridoxal phosphate-dependent enzyme [Planctomycetaceae bacterium]|jgi:aspartate aminotransferase/aminotransferase|nr:aminotransferase class I/II-fold pyridoxal phosphate-dependent enzyme [Planctomycetaceae bacterium]